MRRPKTDALDAQMLVQLAEALVPQAWSPPPQIYHELQQRLHHRHSLCQPPDEMYQTRVAKLLQKGRPILAIMKWNIIAEGVYVMLRHDVRHHRAQRIWDALPAL